MQGVQDFDEKGHQYDYYGVVLVQNSGQLERFPMEPMFPDLGDRSPTRTKEHTTAEGDAFILDLVARQPQNKTEAEAIRAGNGKLPSWMQPMVKTQSEPRVYWLPYVAFIAVKKDYVPMDRLAAQPSVARSRKRARPEEKGDVAPVKAARTSDKVKSPERHAQEDGELMEEDPIEDV